MTFLWRSCNSNANKTTDCIKAGSSYNIKANILTTEEGSKSSFIPFLLTTTHFYPTCHLPDLTLYQSSSSCDALSLLGRDPLPSLNDGRGNKVWKPSLTFSSVLKDGQD